eukprot:3862704-Rhodomonas_salina.1
MGLRGTLTGPLLSPSLCPSSSSAASGVGAGGNGGASQRRRRCYCQASALCRMAQDMRQDATCVCDLC